MFDEKHYVPIIRWKRGEQSALFELDSQIKKRMSPLLEIPPIDWDFENECPKKSIDDHLKNLVTQIKVNWNCSNKLFIDAIQICLDDDEIMDNGEHPLTFIFDSLLNEGIQAIPVTSSNRGNKYQQSVSLIAKKHNTGIALRLNDSDIDDIDFVINKLLNQFSMVPSKIDIVLDFEYINPKIPINKTTNLAIASIISLPNIKDWRTLTIVSTAFPDTLSQFASGTEGSIPRLEWLVYQRLLKSKLTRFPTFGDYIISNPEYPIIDPRFIKMSANIRYTVDNEYLIFRGYSVTSQKYGKWAQAQRLCQKILNHSKYYGKDYSYGDRYIYDCAYGNSSTGNAETWRKVGTNHHLTLVVNEIANFHASLNVGSL